jgi:hypothetical protein
MSTESVISSLFSSLLINKTCQHIHDIAHYVECLFHFKGAQEFRIPSVIISGRQTTECKLYIHSTGKEGKEERLEYEALSSGSLIFTS